MADAETYPSYMVCASVLSSGPASAQGVAHFFVRTFFVNQLCDRDSELLIHFSTLVVHWK